MNLKSLCKSGLFSLLVLAVMGTAAVNAGETNASGRLKLASKPGMRPKTNKQKARIPTHRRCAVESPGGHAILNCVQERAARGGRHLLDVL